MRITAALVVLVVWAGPADAQAIRNPIALFAGLDKITGTITRFEAQIDEVMRFGSLEVKARVCNTRALTDLPKTTAFVEIDEMLLEGGTRRVFTGWMLAESPGLNALEHPVYDVWLTGCHDPSAPAIIREPPPEPIDPDAADIPRDN